MRNKNVLSTTQSAAIAALYTVFTLIANAFGLANYPIQIRFSEALTITPYYTPAAIPGLFVGCLLSNILTGCRPWDVVFGSLATLTGALGTYLIGRMKKKMKIAKWLCPLPPIIANVLVVPQVLMKVYGYEGTLIYFTATVAAGEILSCYVLGMILLLALEKRKGVIPDADSDQ